MIKSQASYSIVKTSLQPGLIQKRLLMSNRILKQKNSSKQNSFEFDSGNNEFYIAEHENAYYQGNQYSSNFKGLTFQNQSKLPDLPIPELNQTIETYLKSIKPYCYNNPNLYNEQVLKCNDLKNNLGPILQQRLIQYQKNENNLNKNHCLNRNWLQKFWDNEVYLEYNDPVVPYVSYFFSHKDLPVSHSKIGNDYLMKSTAIISIIVKFIEALKIEAIPPEVIKGTPFCMNSFNLMFNNSRAPDLENNTDTNIFYSIYENNFIVVAYKNNFYKVLTHDQETLKPYSPNQIYKQLYNIITSKRAPLNTNGIGILTTLPRDQWRETYSKLIQNPESKEALETIHKASFMLCLDADTTTITLEEKARNSWYGDGTNRFFDKPLQFFVTANGSSGFLGEHSKMDGTPNLFLNNYMCQEMLKLNPNEFVAEVLNNETSVEVAKPEKLEFLITPEINQTIKTATTVFTNLMKEHDVKVWHYNKYGKNLIKKHKMSPDAFIHQIIQLAVFKYFGKQLPTYEAASTRKFFKGRTETGRSVSMESFDFVRKWQDDKVSLEEKVEYLRRSAKAHATYLGMASNGQAIDRHFYGLKNMVNKETDEVPELFKDPLFNYSSTWLISTSQLSSEHFDGYGWSQVNDNGFGLAYMINKDWLHINICTKPAKSGFDVNKMHHYLNQAADEIMEVLEATSAPQESLSAKL
ncbi:hypothetical protein Kpol_286p3 [Vanderwaltozyma polyspora DSM 70294]|uniref:Carnitine O-acetyltransferase, mitochondrial n=1 Tax=Vanderwaltozyma polyspora (strain ATCC 22028 / DSM 70294 / BCRC 21397 / CBS 2163 / NBRC 10782 / NRRL Y-8283 / UCD 57-17) TaxID=436907 RepID=A7TT97_VANPO|nr:uncharacterized protein Kpol_286p3 [Vanderwaltozyma polyspora DSM 70294]EDO14510.1 hypothetical protein Kpol_286p3 [Vanderwaltozyma polyspora DSM 70294]